MDNVEKYKAVYKQYKTWKNDLTSRKILHARLEEIFLKLNYREKEILSLWTASEAVSEWDD